ncbi:cell division protein FtsQ/DivIB [Legionella sp. W05-934-2]|jgi:cell division protein FtsQ|uniref:cell division protein FtsQ/DivIB n=1 Tax=Legionella sp. W05-934-2 TaxID=1198649 RepID=UPI0034630314
MANDQIEPERKPIKLFLLIVFAVFLIFRCFYLFFSDPERFPIDVVKVESPFKFVDRKTIEKTISPFLEKSFFTLPVHQLHQQLNALNGIEQVDVKRLWPDQLVLHFEERHPIASWHNQLITPSGEVFSTKDPAIFDNLPKLEGPEKNKKDILHTYQKLSKILSGYGFYCRELSYSPAQGWQLRLKNDMLIELGNQQIISRLERFLRRLPAIQAESSARINYADLRYKQGVAVKYEQ